MDRHSTQNSNTWVILCFILLFALALRLYGINFEVPHPDDYITVQGAMHFGPARVPLTGYGLYSLYVWPGFTLVEIQIILFTAYVGVGWLAGFFPDMETVRTLYLTDPSSFYLIGRLMSVFFAIGTIWILYGLARRLYNQRVGLMASLFLSASFIHSFHSQFIRPDIPATFFTLSSIGCCLILLEKKELKYYVYAGMLTGLAIATKFTSGILILVLLVAHFIAERDRLSSPRARPTGKNLMFLLPVVLGTLVIIGSMSTSVIDVPAFLIRPFLPGGRIDKPTMAFLNLLRNIGFVMGILFILAGILQKVSLTAGYSMPNWERNRNLLFALFVSILAFIVLDPIFFLDLKKQMKVFIYTPMFLGRNETFAGAGGLGPIGNFWWYIKGPLCWGAGLHIEIMAVLGLLITLSRKKKEDIIFILFPVLYFVVICFGHLKWARYAIYLMPFQAIYAACFLDALMKKIGHQRLALKVENTVLTLVSITVIIVPVYNIVRYDYLLTQKDTRVMSKQWVEKNIPVGSRIGQDAYTGDISEDLFQITRKYSLGNESFEYYVKNGFQYLLVSDTQYRRFFDEAEKFPKVVLFYKTLFQKGKLVKEFIPRSDLWPRPEDRFKKYHIHISPTIKIYKITNI